MPTQRHLFSWLLAALIPAFAMWMALTSPLEERSFDAASFHIMRAVVYSDARANGLFYPRWVDSIDAGMGGPLFNFYSPLSYWLMDALHRFGGVSIALAWRILIATATLTASLGMFGLGLHLFRRADVALLAAACFTYAPVMLRDLFERGSPEGIAFALGPLMLWQLCRLVERPSGLRLALAAISWAAIILMHNLTAVLLLPVLLLIALWLVWQRRPRLIILATALILGSLLAGMHVIPFFLERGDVQINNASAEKYTQLTPATVPLPDLLAPPVILDAGLDNNFTGFGIGWLHVLPLLVGLIGSVVLWRRHRADGVLVLALSILGLTLILLRTEAGNGFWQAFSILETLQIRWRILSLIGLIAAITGGFVVSLILGDMMRSWRCAVIPILVGGYLLFSLPMLYVNLFHRYITLPLTPTLADLPDFARQVNAPGLTLTAFNEFLPRWWRDPLTFGETQFAASQPIANLPDGAKVLSTDRTTNQLSIQIQTPGDFAATVRLLYFPGWQATVNGQDQPVWPQDGSDYIQINVPAGTSMITLHYGGTTAQYVGDATSLVTLVGLLLIAALWRSRSTGKAVILVVRPRWWIPASLIAVLLLKGLWLDPDTSLLRWSSTCTALHGPTFHPVAPTDVDFASTSQPTQKIHLCGYSLGSASYHGGDTLKLTLYWQIDQPEAQVATAFVHLLGQQFNPATNNPLWGQEDKQIPARHPLPDWVPSKLYADDYSIDIPATTPPGDYQVELGWYGTDGQRYRPTLTKANPTVSLSTLDSLLISGLTIR